MFALPSQSGGDARGCGQDRDQVQSQCLATASLEQPTEGQPSAGEKPCLRAFLGLCWPWCDHL